MKFENEICGESKTNPKAFWKLTLKIKDRTKLILCYDDQTKAVLLNSYFSSLFINDRSVDIRDANESFGIGSIRLSFTSEDIKR